MDLLIFNVEVAAAMEPATQEFILNIELVRDLVRDQARDRVSGPSWGLS